MKTKTVELDEMFKITDHLKQLGRCPTCGNESIKLTSLVEWGMCAPCYVRVLKKAFDLLAIDYTMEQIAKQILVEKVKLEDLGDGKFYFPESQMTEEIKRVFEDYIGQAKKGFEVKNSE